MHEDSPQPQERNYTLRRFLGDTAVTSVLMGATYAAIEGASALLGAHVPSNEAFVISAGVGASTGAYASMQRQHNR